MAKKVDARVVATAAVVVQMVVGPLTLRDIAQRRRDQLRGPRWLWRLWAGSNVLGSATYWLVGRRPGVVELVRVAGEPSEGTGSLDA